MRWFHGLSAYNKAGKSRYCPIETRRRVDVIKDGVEIACSDKAIGPFGVVVDGFTKEVYIQDCWSRVVKGRRVHGKYHDRTTTITWDVAYEEKKRTGRNSSYDDAESFGEAFVHQWCHDNSEWTYYREAFVKDCTIIAVWVKEDASDRRYWQARSLALKLRVPLVFVTKETTIGEWCDTVKQVDQEDEDQDEWDSIF